MTLAAAHANDPSKSVGSSQRFLYIDALRGMLLIMMAVNHIPSDLQIATNHVFGFVSAAEGFVFLSGLMSGLVYARKYYKSGWLELKEGAMRRASGIYIYHVVTFLLVLLGVRFCLAWTGTAPSIAPSIMLDHPLRAIIAGLTLVQQPSLFDILPMYCVFLCTVPAIILACVRGHRSAVLIASFLLWLLANIFSPQTPLVHGAINTGSFNLLAWQFLFVLGTVFGHAWATGDRLWPKANAALIAIALLAATLLYGLRHAYLPSPIPGSALDWLTNKNNVAPLRLLNTAILYYLVYVVADRFPKLLTWRATAFLGQHSMFVFAAHIVVAYSIQAFPEVTGATAEGRWLSTIALIGSMFAAAAIHQTWQGETKRRTLQLDARQA